MPNRDDSDEQPDAALALLARATEGLDADERFTDALFDGPLRRPGDAPDLDAALARAARATDALAPAASFSDAVLRSVAPAPPRLAEGLTRSGPWALLLAAVAAAACLFFSVETQHEVDASIVASVDAVEVSE